MSPTANLWSLFQGGMPAQASDNPHAVARQAATRRAAAHHVCLGVPLAGALVRVSLAATWVLVGVGGCAAGLDSASDPFANSANTPSAQSRSTQSPTWDTGSDAPDTANTPGSPRSQGSLSSQTSGAPRSQGLTVLGYSARSLYRADVRTIAIEMFNSREFRRQWEFKVTEAVAKRVELETGWKIVHPSRADTLLTGEILGIPLYILGEEPNTVNLREFQVAIQVRWIWKDLRTGRILYEVVSPLPEIGYSFSYPQFLESINVGLNLSVDHVARQIVNSLRDDF